LEGKKSSPSNVIQAYILEIRICNAIK